jgi:prolipoprotein diacylglyceryltransferase
VHPTQLYESAAGVLLLGLVLLARRRRRRPGEAFVAFTIGYAALRFLIEVLRADPHRGSLGPFSTSQAVALATLAAGLALLASLRRAGLRRRAPGAQTASG